MLDAYSANMNFYLLVHEHQTRTNDDLPPIERSQPPGALRQLSIAPRRDVKSLRNWHHNHEHKDISEKEQKYLERDEDLVALAHEEKTPLRQVIDGSHRLRTLSLWRHREEEVATYDKREVSYYSDKRMDNFASAVIIAIGVLMLITPIWILQALTELKPKLAVITIFIFGFLLVLSLAMVAKPFEALGAIAAYDSPCSPNDRKFYR
ncbi:hypothetical protein CORC01_02349 [Colletotrichum orchidophilum]|uniref:DUF6594 domain-containing protein n=1 Tax=Colletotrichum orchidophilum TaxID=1209926 RepID=A0A1G4BM21_9PEZI|nr:uncharacterized protein CORC01_02349 [Colletotrichum orchidophilum]OHF02356.1 hypothetical protein CORC01_02349 [Colletotrichum orchidophilum]